MAVLALGALLTVSSGCTALRARAIKTIPLERLIELSARVDASTYRLTVGDLIATRCYFNPQLDDELMVRPDGKISLSMIGDVMALGKTVDQLSQEISAEYAKYFVQSKTVVIVRQFNSQRIFIAGEVKTPGQFSLVNNARTVLESIANSGGVTLDATLEKVILIRRLPGGGAPLVAELDLSRALSGEDPLQNVSLMPDDYIYVPRSGGADAGLAMEQFVFNIAGVKPGFTVTYPILPLVR